MEGNGSDRQPYKPSVDPYELFGSMGNVDVIITGSGASGDPWVVEMNQNTLSGVTEVLYTADDVWVKPSGINVVHVEAIGGGAGGQTVSSTTEALYGGSGGNGGQRATMTIPALLLPDEVPITVGPGGLGGQNNGDHGDPGAYSFFGELLAGAGGQLVPPNSAGMNGTSTAPRVGGSPPDGGPGDKGASGVYATAVEPTTLPERVYVQPPGGGRGEIINPAAWPSGTNQPRTLGRTVVNSIYPNWKGGDGGQASPLVAGEDGQGPGAGGGGAPYLREPFQTAPAGDGANGLVRVRMW